MNLYYKAGAIITPAVLALATGTASAAPIPAPTLPADAVTPTDAAGSVSALAGGYTDEVGGLVAMVFGLTFGIAMIRIWLMKAGSGVMRGRLKS